MDNHLIFIFYIFLFLFSTIGYGFLFSKLIYNQFARLNFGYQGIIGFFLLSLISMVSSFFFSHNYIHNILIHIIGLTSFFTHVYTFKNSKELKHIVLVTILFLIAIYVYKNHDDFPYYHLTYSLNLTNNSFIIGSGVLGHGFRTFSSLFYYHSLLYLPGIEIYLFHAGPFFILIFFNYVILSNLKEKFINKEINFLYFFSLLSLIFVNIVFYRIGEHGTDRSAQILLLLIFLIFFEITFYQKNKEKIYKFLFLLLILIFLASSMKAIYYLYLIIIPIILLKKKIFKFLFFKKNLLIISFLSLSLLTNLTINYLSTGCLLYPAEKTCIIEQKWSINKNEVRNLALHYEWWAKAGGGPDYSAELTKENYVKNFNWLDNWIDRHFFNKVSDTLLGIILISILILIFGKKISSKRKKKLKNINFQIYLIPLIFLVEWFLNHPAMRYGGYVLFAIPLFIFTSIQLDLMNIKLKKIINFTLSFLLVTYLIFLGRNFVRLEKEVSFYKYNLVKSPFFYVKNVEDYEIFDNGQLKIYSTKNNEMCWASKTPCTYNKDLNVTKYLWFNVIFRND